MMQRGADRALHRALVARDHGDPEKALRRLGKALRRYPANPRLRFHYGMLLLDHRPDNSGAQELLEAARAAADDPAYLVNIASVLLVNGYVEAASVMTDQVAKLAHPDFEHEAYLRNVQGRLADTAGRQDEAEPLLRQAASLEPDDRMFVGDLAAFLLRQGARAEALALLDQLSPGDQAASRIQELRAQATQRT